MVTSSIFTIAWDFPPVFTGESIVCYKTLKYSKYDYDVCYNSSNLVNEKYEYTHKINAIPLAGGYFDWSRKVLKTFLNLDRIKKYDTFESRVMPSAGHFAGFLIKLFRPKIKWIVYFSDPVWNSPYCNLIDQIKGKIKKHDLFYIMIYSSIFSWLAIRMCDKIVFNNEYLAKHVLGKSYNKLTKKICIVPYGYDKNVLDSIVPLHVKEDKFTISHVGQIYGARNFNTLVTGLKIIKTEYPQTYANILVRQIGYICAEEKQKIINSGVKDSFEFIDSVNFEESLAYMKSSDYLLTIDALFSELDYNLYIPSKIFDYIGVKKPIVAISQSVGPTSEIVKTTGNILIEHNSETMVNFLLQAVNGDIKKPDFDKYDFYDCKIGAEAFDKIFEKLKKKDNI